MKVITINSGKGGGSFKTTTAWVLATWLNKEGYKPLIIDYETNSTISGYMGADFTNCPTMYHVYTGDVDIKDAIQQTSMSHIIAGNATVDKISALYFNDILNGIKALKKQIPKLEEMGFTHVIIDNQASVGALQHLQALIAANDLIIPFHPDNGSLQGFTNLLDSLKEAKEINPALRIDGILLGNIRNPITTNEKFYVGEMVRWATHIGAKIYRSVIRAGIAIQNAQGNVQTLWDSYPNENVTHDFENFVLEYMENNKESKIT